MVDQVTLGKSRQVRYPIALRCMSDEGRQEARVLSGVFQARLGYVQQSHAKASLMSDTRKLRCHLCTVLVIEILGEFSTSLKCFIMSISG